MLLFHSNKGLLQTTLIIGLGLLCLPAIADCKAHYAQSTQLLEAALEKSKSGQASVDTEAFEKTFKESVQQLQTEKCLPELLNLIQRIQSEQQKYPPSGEKTKPAPIVD